MVLSGDFGAEGLVKKRLSCAATDCIGARTHVILGKQNRYNLVRLGIESCLSVIHLIIEFRRVL